MQRNRVSDHGLPPGFEDALFQAISKIGVTLSSFLRYVDNLLPSSKPASDIKFPGGQVVEDSFNE
ncbi:hypothetical protein PHISP_05799 [Aspergillus sp. HF37]|nr:hypothetical protein PHISP_05799 [Aspergillus sp. HF37]